jgi:hypothetical protein
MFSFMQKFAILVVGLKTKNKQHCAHAYYTHSKKRMVWNIRNLTLAMIRLPGSSSESFWEASGKHLAICDSDVGTRQGNIISEVRQINFLASTGKCSRSRSHGLQISEFESNCTETFSNK